MRSSFQITRESVLQTETNVNSKLKFLVLNGLRRGTGVARGTHPLRETEAPKGWAPKMLSGFKARPPPIDMLIPLAARSYY